MVNVAIHGVSGFIVIAQDLLEWGWWSVQL